jgi:surface glycoprotein (TIGR04207 family)
MSGHEKSRAVVLAALMVVSVFAAGIAFTGTVAAEELTVSGGDGLQQRINEASPGDTITVVDSEEYDGITVDTADLTIQAADGETPTIVYDEGNGNGVVNIMASGVTLDGFIVDATSDDSSTQSRNTVYVVNQLDNVTISNNEIVDGPAYAQANTNITIVGNNFSVDEDPDPGTDIFISDNDANENRVINGENTVNDQIVALVQDNTGAQNVDIGDTDYGITLSQENVTTSNNFDDGQVSVTATVYGAEGDGDLQYTLTAPDGSVRETDEVSNDGDGPTEFTFESFFTQEGEYEVTVEDSDSSSTSGSTTLNSSYEVTDLQPDTIEAGTSPEVNGTLVDRGGDAVSGETVALNVNDDQVAETETNDDGTFALNTDMTFSEEDYVTVTGDDADDDSDDSDQNANNDVFYANIPVGPADPTWEVTANDSSVPFERPTSVLLTVSEDGNRVTGDELTNTDVTATQDGTSVLTDEVDSDQVEYVDQDGDDIENETNGILIDVEATQQDTPINVTVTETDDDEDFGTTQIAVGQDDDQPPAQGNIDAPANAMFGDVNVSETKTQTITVNNEGDASVTVNETSISGSDAFTVVNGGAPFTLGPGESQDITVQFAPDSTGDESASLTIDTENDGTETTQLSGTGVEADQPPAVGDISAPANTMFGDVNVSETKDQTVTVVNDGNAPVEVIDTSIEGANGTEFFVVNNPAGNAQDDQSFTLAPGESRDLTVRFAPSATGDKSANLDIVTENDGSEEVQLSGTGVEAQDNRKTLRIEGTGNYAFYAFQASGDVELTESDSEEQVAGSSATGAVGPGSDTYTFTGDLSKFYLEGDAKVFVNGEPRDVSGLESTVSFNGDDSVTSYNFEVKNGEITGSQSITREDNIDDSDDQATGAVGPGSDTYSFTGTFQGLDKDDGATVVLNGIPVKPSLFYNTLRFEGQGSFASYNFDVNGEIKDTRSLTKEDTVSGPDGSQVEGAISSGADTYVYSGSLETLNTDGDIVIVRNGKEITENYDDA